MIIQRYLLREMTATFGGVALLLCLIFLSGTFIQILSEAATGFYPARLVLELFALKGIGNLVFILPLAFFIAVLLALGRLYRDSEMTALYACGIGTRTVYLTVGGLALAVALLLAALALFFTPWAEDRSYQLLDEAGAESEVEGLAAGRFNVLGAGEYLVYVEAISSDRQRLSGVFAHGAVDGRQQLLSAERALQRLDPTSGERYLVFVDGTRYEGRPGEADYKIINFAEHGIRLVEREVVRSERRHHAIASSELWGSARRNDRVELQRRLDVPLLTVLLGLLAVPLSRTSPRDGRYGKLFIGIVAYIVYNNLLTMARANVSKGEVAPEVGLWWVHLLMLVLVIMIIWYQRRLRDGWRWRFWRP